MPSFLLNNVRAIQPEELFNEAPAGRETQGGNELAEVTNSKPEELSEGDDFLPTAADREEDIEFVFDRLPYRNSFSSQSSYEDEGAHPSSPNGLTHETYVMVLDHNLNLIRRKLGVNYPTMIINDWIILKIVAKCWYMF